MGRRKWESILEYVSPVVTDELNELLQVPFSDIEIKEATMQMGGLKASGPDGFQGAFYHSFWDILREEVNVLVKLMEYGEVFPRLLNATHILLIPKIPNPESVSQFRLISLCNYSYKILAKVLENRLKSLLPQLISPMQNAFVGGHQIQDNIRIAHELFHFLKLRKAKCQFELGIKLDMQKKHMIGLSGTFLMRLSRRWVFLLGGRSLSWDV